MTSAPLDDLTVVVITRDRCAEVCRTLARLAALPEQPGVIVVDNGSSDGTVDAIRRDHPEVCIVPLGWNAGGAGRNAGVALAATPFVAFCDDDTWWASGSLARAADLLRAHPRLAVVTARIVVEPHGTVDAISEEMAASPLPRPPDAPRRPLLSFLAGASVVRTRAFRAVGGFCGHLLIGGEEELAGTDLAQAGWAMAYAADVEIHHHASTLRDPHLRRRQGIRNTLWYTWLRRRTPGALRSSARLAGGLPHDRHSAAALAAAVRGGWWVAAGRRPVDPDIEAELRALEDDRPASSSRQYVS